ncbi:MAG: MBL fold metallo-hydrolase [Elusimicrobia bacterium]|nr:MBL fold metallo-hydrolase [Elusimicrobiota bacterium]
MRRALAAAALLAALAGCLPELPQGKNPWLVMPPPKPTDIRKIPHTFALSLLSGRGADSVRMSAVNTGTVRTHGETVSAMKSFHAKLKLDAPVFVIRHSSAGVVLFGTGLSSSSARRPESVLDVLQQRPFTFKQKRGQDIVSQLALQGIGVSEVRWVVVSALEPEQAGFLDAFPEATVVLSEREWDWRKGRQKSPPAPLDPAAFEGRIKLKLVDLANSPSFGPFENGMDLLGDGSLMLVNLPGRTPGTLGLWVNLDGGPVLLAGSAAYVLDNYLDVALPVKGRFDDLQEYWRTLHMIQAAMKGVPRLTVVPGNDLSPLRLSGRRDVPITSKK